MTETVLGYFAEIFFIDSLCFKEVEKSCITTPLLFLINNSKVVSCAICKRIWQVFIFIFYIMSPHIFMKNCVELWKWLHNNKYIKKVNRTINRKNEIETRSLSWSCFIIILDISIQWCYWQHKEIQCEHLAQSSSEIPPYLLPCQQRYSSWTRRFL